MTESKFYEPSRKEERNLEIESNIRHGKMVNAIQNTMFDLGHSITWTQTEDFIVKLHEIGYNIHERYSKKRSD